MKEEVLAMASKFRSQINRLDTAHLKTQKPKFEIGFVYQINTLDRQTDIDLDLIELMRVLGFKEAFEVCNQYYAMFPASLAEPLTKDLDKFYSYLKEIGIFDPQFEGYKQTPQTPLIYEKIIKA